ncbi:hypothetical protein PUN28_001904 [Cardiocondyla obscurior]|uniref:Uncharacterized protein n=1 Tax=Cardiocondyla obscurior TaxID=286306 RepID=A0AAW2GRY6_9HYME
MRQKACSKNAKETVRKKKKKLKNEMQPGLLTLSNCYHTRDEQTNASHFDGFMNTLGDGEPSERIRCFLTTAQESELLRTRIRYLAAIHLTRDTHPR